jgi:hypothetical protein
MSARTVPGTLNTEVLETVDERGSGRVNTTPRDLDPTAVSPISITFM